jgi:hypothetical protein
MLNTSQPTESGNVEERPIPATTPERKRVGEEM